MLRIERIGMVLLCALGAFSAQGQQIDGTVALVGTRMVLQSDVEMELMRMRMQGIPVNANSRCEVLESLLLKNVLLDQADLDSVVVKDSEVSAEVDRRVQFFLQQVGSEEELVKQYGKPMRAIRSELATMLSEQRRTEQVRSSVVGNVKIAPSQVKSFYERTPQDSLPMMPEAYVYRQLVMTPISSENATFDVKERLLKLRQRILNGERFSTLAMAYSEDRGSAAKGGEMGYMPRESFVKPFADAAFALQDGQVSQIVETEYGFHIIQMIGKRGKTANVRHILLKPHYTSTMIQATKEKLDSIRTEVLADSLTFERACYRYSTDKETRLNGGIAINPMHGSMKLDKESMVPSDYYEVRALEPNGISKPFESQDIRGNVVVKLIQLVRRIPMHRATIEEDYDVIQNLAKKEKEKDLFESWLAKKEQSLYVTIDPKFAGCTFQREYWSHCVRKASQGEK